MSAGHGTNTHHSSVNSLLRVCVICGTKIWGLKSGASVSKGNKGCWMNERKNERKKEWMKREWMNGIYVSTNRCNCIRYYKLLEQSGCWQNDYEIDLCGYCGFWQCQEYPTESPEMPAHDVQTRGTLCQWTLPAFSAHTDSVISRA